VALSDRDRLLAVRALATAERRRVDRQRAVLLANREQFLVNAEVRETRRDLLRAARHRAGHAGVLFDPQFRLLADLPVAKQAVLAAAACVGFANSCDLQLCDQRDGSLRIVASYGFRAAFLAAFAVVTPAQLTSCAAALASRVPVLVSDITHTEFFGAATMQPMLEAGTRAVASYPLLLAGGEAFGVLSFHYHRIGLRSGDPALVARGAGMLLPPLLAY
jgi:GAF domain